MDIKNYGKIGFGTFGSDKYDDETVAAAVYGAICAGYRIFDCASVYGNEIKIGEVFKKAIGDGVVKREELFIISKVWNDMHGRGDTVKSCIKSIEDLGVGYLDIYLTHWPFPNYHPKGCNVDSRNPDSKPFFAEEFLKTWREMEFLKENGYVRDIGMSNMTIAKFDAVLPNCNIKPTVHEMELHPSFQQSKLYDYCKENGMEIIGYCPLGSPNRPERDKTPNDEVDTAIPEIVEIASAYDKHPIDICLAWAASRGHIPIPFASKAKNIINNFESVNWKLDSKDMEKIKRADKNCRLVKGHVFLWNGAADWRDLWDEDGKIRDWKYINNTWVKEK